MEISVIIPVFNEIEFLVELVKSILSDKNRYTELLLVDGGSTDGTRERIIEFTKSNNQIKLVDNPERYVSFGFNKALNLASGKYIAFLGAHAKYSKNYLIEARCILDNGKADAVGGILKQKGKNWKGEVIAKMMSSVVGVGNSPFRTKKAEQYVESVAFAVYHKKIFDKIGNLDEELVRNQDDEFHYRLNQAGFKILMTPRMQATYFVRDNLKALFSQYFQYGLYKPMVIKKVPGGFRWRHLIPLLFVIYIFCLPVGLCLIPSVYLIPFIFYLLIVGLKSLSLNKGIIRSMYGALAAFCLHFAYGLGTLLGLKKVF